MKIIKIKNRILGKEPFVIAEIGNNHQGSLQKAIQLIKAAKDQGATAVKFEKDLTKNFILKIFIDTPYIHVNSYAKTYGKHRDYLEFSLSQYKKLMNYAKKIGSYIFATPFDFKSVDFLEKLKVPCYKIASGDLTNTPLQEYIAKKISYFSQHRWRHF